MQSYGSRCVKPPIIYGDVRRPKPMTVLWSQYAQSLTDKPMKGMLTGPVTILNWSFVRDDQPRSITAYQLALAIREEVKDLERAGIPIIQIDEAAFREGLPPRQSRRNHNIITMSSRHHHDIFTTSSRHLHDIITTSSRYHHDRRAL